MIQSNHINTIRPDTLEPQIGTKDIPFRCSKVERDVTKPPIFKNREYSYNWIHTFKYLDGSGFFQIYEPIEGKRYLL